MVPLRVAFALQAAGGITGLSTGGLLLAVPLRSFPSLLFLALLGFAVFLGTVKFVLVVEVSVVVGGQSL